MHPTNTATLAARLHVLDLRVATAELGAASLTEAFVEVTSNIANRGTPDDEAEIVEAAWADDSVSKSSFLAVLSAVAPFLGEAAGAEQRWIATGRPSWLPRRVQEPSIDAFQAVGDADPVLLTSHPVTAGLYTSSAHDDFPGMWRLFLDSNPSSQLWPKPWTTWRLMAEPYVRLRSVSTACEWVTLVNEYPLRDGAWVRINWRAVARDYDAVHVSPTAVIAIDGIAFRHGADRIAPSYWTVESTFWLAWCFRAVELVPTATTLKPA